MMSIFKQAIYPGGKDTATGAYSPGLIAGDWVFVSGQGPLNTKTGQFENLDIEHQTKLTLNNVRRVLQASDSDMNQVVKVTVHLQNINDFDRFDKAYVGYFKKPYPARTTVQSVLAEGISIEIDVIAMRRVGKVPEQAMGDMS